MRSRIPRLIAVLCMTVAIGSCNEHRVLSPDSDGILFASAAAGTAPSGLSSSVVSSAQINLRWTDNSTNEDGFEIQRSTNGIGGPFAQLAQMPPNAVTYSSLGLTASTEYCYEVRAWRKLGKNTVYTDFSNSTCATTLPAAPSNANATPASSAAVDVTWTDNSTTEYGFRVERAAGTQGPWTLLTTTPANATSYRDPALTTEQLVCYRVTTSGPSGFSAPSNVDCTAPPATPDNLTATSPSNGVIDLTWSDKSAVEDGYEVQRSSPGIAFTVVASLPANAVSYHDATVSNDVQFNYRVRAKKDGGFSDYSAVASAISATTPPIAPTGLTAVPPTSTEIDLAWEDNSTNESGFRVERSIDGQVTWVAAYTMGPGDGNTQRVNDLNRTPDQKVCYRVFAFNARASSAPSNVVCTAAPAAPTDLVATTASDYAIDLHWVNHSAVADGYIVQRVYYGGYYYYYEYYETIATLGPNETSYHDGGHGPGEFNTYRVLALKDNGQSDPSNQAGAWTEPPPPAPAGLTAKPGTAGHIDLEWTYDGVDADYFAIERCDAAEIYCDDSSFYQIDYVGSSSLAYSDGTVQSGVSYTYRVRTWRRSQPSGPTNTASATAP